MRFSLWTTAPDEICLHVQRKNNSPSYHVERFVLRTDGFVSVHADFKGGEFVTKSLIFKGESLFLNFATSAAGSIQVEIQDLNHKSLPGFSLRESPVMFGDKIEGQVEWLQTAEKSHASLLAIAGQPIRIRFVMKDADLYSIQFR